MRPAISACARSSSCRRRRRTSRSRRCGRSAPKWSWPATATPKAKTRCDELVRETGLRARASVRRSAGHRRPGHDRQRDSAAQARRRLGDLRAGRRRRPHRRHRQLRQGAAAEDPRHRRRAVRGGRDVSVARGRAPGRARSRRDFRRRRRGPRGRRDHVSDRADDASKKSSGSRTTRSAPRSRTSSTTPGQSWSPRARSRWRACGPGWSDRQAGTRGWSRS